MTAKYQFFKFEFKTIYCWKWNFLSYFIMPVGKMQFTKILCIRRNVPCLLSLKYFFVCKHYGRSLTKVQVFPWHLLHEDTFQSVQWKVMPAKRRKNSKNTTRDTTLGQSKLLNYSVLNYSFIDWTQKTLKNGFVSDAKAGSGLLV